MKPPDNHEDAIPKEFHSEYEERPFQACSRCGESLSAFSAYQVNKAFRSGECVFEYCFCEVCRDALIEEFSEESKANLTRYQQEHLQEDATGTGQCAFCCIERTSIPKQDFIITMVGSGSRMLDSLLICESCQLAMHEVLSVKTRDVRRRFFEDLPGVPPDWQVWSPEEVERHRHLESGKAPSPSLKPHLAGEAKSTRHLADDGCLELLWLR